MTQFEMAAKKLAEGTALLARGTKLIAEAYSMLATEVESPVTPSPAPVSPAPIPAPPTPQNVLTIVKNQLSVNGKVIPETSKVNATGRAAGHKWVHRNESGEWWGIPLGQDAWSQIDPQGTILLYELPDPSEIPVKIQIEKGEPKTQGISGGNEDLTQFIK